MFWVFGENDAGQVCHFGIAFFFFSPLRKKGEAWHFFVLEKQMGQGEWLKQKKQTMSLFYGWKFLLLGATEALEHPSLRQFGNEGRCLLKLALLTALHYSKASIPVQMSQSLLLAATSGSPAAVLTKPFSRTAQMERKKLNPILFLLPQNFCFPLKFG